MSKFNYFQCTVTATGRFYVQVHEILYITNVDVLLTMYLSIFLVINLLTPNVNYSGRTAPLTNKVAFYIFIQQIYVLNILNMVYTLLFFYIYIFQNAVCFIIVTYLVPVLFALYIQGVLKLKKK